MQTDNSTVAAIWTAWQMTESIADQIRGMTDTPENKAKRLRQIYIENYKAVLQAMQSNPEETGADFA